MAPAAVLCLMTLLLCFLQFTYWDLSVKRQQAKNLKTAFIALAEADMASQRMESIVGFLAQAQIPEAKDVKQLSFLHEHLLVAFERLLETELLGVSDTSLLRQRIWTGFGRGFRLFRVKYRKAYNYAHSTSLYGLLHWFFTRVYVFGRCT